MLTRRTFLRGVAAGAALVARPRLLPAAEASATISLLELGRLAPLHSKQITNSPFSVGFETLDRKGFDPKPTYEPLGKLGIKWARVQTGWCRCETVKGKYDFAWLDEVVDSLTAQGIQPWFNLGFGNPLYIPESHTPFAVGYAPLFTPEARAGWTAFVEAAAKHFAGRVTHWEIWNEPNIKPFWRPGEPSAAEYMDLVKITTPLLRRWVPNSTLIGFGLAGAAVTKYVPYVEQCLDAGIADHVDVFSHHPYSDNPEAGDDFVAEVRKLLDQRHCRTRLWQGECGRWAGVDPRRPKLPWNEARQARWVLRRALNDLRLGMELTSYFHAVDLLNYSHGGEVLKARIGLLRGEDCSPRPSYVGYQSLCTLFDSQTRLDASLTPACEAPSAREVKSAGFVRQGRALYALWQVVDVLKDFVPGRMAVRLPTPASAAIADPVLVDPLSQRVYRISGKSDGGVLAIAGLPLLDYPLLVTDRSVVPMHS